MAESREIKRKEGLDLSNPDLDGWVAPKIVGFFGAYSDTSSVVDALMKYQEEQIDPKAHKSRDELREMIRTFNPNNQKFNHAKWGELLEELRREFIADLRSQTGDSISRMLTTINQAVKTAQIKIETPKDLLDAARAMALLQQITKGSSDNPMDLKALESGTGRNGQGDAD